jgi:putative lipoprotein (rSAM/lipoprotein system)
MKKYACFSIKMLGFCLAFTGIVSCDVKVTPPSDPPEVPTVSYRMNGTVIGSDNLQKIAGIETDMVNMVRVDGLEIAGAIAPAVHTNDSGYVELSLQTIGLPSTDSVVFLVRFYDVDGAENGAYADSIHRAVIYQPTYVGGSGWYGGEAVGSFGVIAMKSR